LHPSCPLDRILPVYLQRRTRNACRKPHLTVGVWIQQRIPNLWGRPTLRPSPVHTIPYLYPIESPPYHPGLPVLPHLGSRSS
jgi:hypothetical protein